MVRLRYTIFLRLQIPRFRHFPPSSFSPPEVFLLSYTPAVFKEAFVGSSESASPVRVVDYNAVTSLAVRLNRDSFFNPSLRLRALRPVPGTSVLKMKLSVVARHVSLDLHHGRSCYSPTISS